MKSGSRDIWGCPEHYLGLYGGGGGGHYLGLYLGDNRARG